MHCTSAVMAIGRAVRGYRLSVILVMALLLGVIGIPARSAPDSAPAPEKKLRVVVKPAEPFSFEKDGEITGYSVELWKRIADESGLPYEMKMVKTMPEALGALEKGEADVAVGAISITQDRER